MYIGGMNGQVHAALALQCRMHVVRRGRSLSGSSKVTRLNTHNMAKKIEGLSRYTDISPSGRIVVRLLGESDYQCKAVTVVVHEGTHERVFTESEVRAIVDRIGRANVLPEALYSWSVHVAKEAGVCFDPA